MKIKTLQIRKKAILIFIGLMLNITGAIFGQSDTSWQAIGSDTVLTKNDF